MASLLRERTFQSFRLFNLPIEQKWAPKGTQLKAGIWQSTTMNEFDILE